MLQKEGQTKISSGCAISAIMNRKGDRFSGAQIIKSIGLMHDRSNGLGGGFAAYGIYPEYKNLYALHVFYDSIQAKNATEEYLNLNFNIEIGGRIPTRKVKSIINAPLIWRYFVLPNKAKLIEAELGDEGEDEFVARAVLEINGRINGTYIFSSGKNMGAFKAVGYPEDVGDFYMLEKYSGHLWTAHGRFPTNTPGWWGGAHPFTILDWSIVHNGEISSYDTNRRFVEMFGYNCSLQTDTEVITYLFDYFVRKQKLTLLTAANIMAAPMWSEIDQMDDVDKEYFIALRRTYSRALINGPFSIIVGSNDALLALNDRLKLRALMAAEKGDFFYLASEEAAIRVLENNPDKLWSVEGGHPIIVELDRNR